MSDEAEFGWQYMPGPANPEMLRVLAESAPVSLPSEYLAFLQLHDGGEGELGAEPGWFHLWPVGEVLARNSDYEVAKYLPGFFGFGSNGAGELLAFDCRSPAPWPIVMVPFIGMDSAEAWPVAADFAAFARLLGKVV